jgi:outer membrane protein OmpA-like peptidoglycan-associated protein
MKKTALLLFVFSLCCATLTAQNLVVNPGFEEYKKGTVVTSNTFATYRVKGWDLTTAGTPDWYCNNPAARMTSSELSIAAAAGKIDPHSGNSYAGIIGFSRTPQGEEYTEYVRGSLNAMPVADHVYTVSFWVAQAKNSDLKIDSLGVCLFEDQFRMDTATCRVTMKAQTKFAVDTFKTWTLVQGEFVADGTERFFFIGNFALNFERSGKYYTRPSPGWHKAYYYIDDVVIAEKNTSGMLAITAGQKLSFSNILFETGKATLQPASNAQLDQIVTALKKQSALKVQICGHTDSDGDAQANQTLSEQRAVAVKNYLISKGIDSTRITTRGFGSSQPLGTDKSKNRRVEFLFSE